MSYYKRLDKAFEHASILPITPDSQYVFFSDCHRGTGSNNDNFLKNSDCYFAALQYYYQYGFCYIEAGDGDELWENCTLSQIMEIHNDIFYQLEQFNKERRLYMLYGNHDMVKKEQIPTKVLYCAQNIFPQTYTLLTDIRPTYLILSFGSWHVSLSVTFGLLWNTSEF